MWTAANLIPLALAHPRARFIGCDLSRSALGSAQRLIDGLGLTNVELRHVDICDVDDGWGAFDYVLCHDVFSWVAPTVRQKILSVEKRNLAPRGVGYLFYDALPGWRLHGLARDMMRYHAAGLSDPRQAVDQARRCSPWAPPSRTRARAPTRTCCARSTSASARSATSSCITWRSPSITRRSTFTSSSS